MRIAGLILGQQDCQRYPHLQKKPCQGCRYNSSQNKQVVFLIVKESLLQLIKVFAEKTTSSGKADQHYTTLPRVHACCTGRHAVKVHNGLVR